MIDFRADGVVEVGELAADGARADDGEAFGLLLEVHGLAAGDDVDAVEGCAGQRRGACAGGDDDMLGGDFLGALGRSDLDAMGREQLADAGFALHFVFAEEVLDSAAELYRRSRGCG